MIKSNGNKHENKQRFMLRNTKAAFHFLPLLFHQILYADRGIEYAEHNSDDIACLWRQRHC